jgi:hypothetical protein
MKMFLDSGAFSIWKEFDKSGRVLEGKALWDYVDAYANYIKQNIKLIDVYVNVDIPFRPDVTLEVQNYMEKKHKLHPIPVYHPGEPVQYLINYIKKHDYIGMGGIGAGNISKQAWMTSTGERAFEIICDNPKKIPKVKVHGFAMTSPALMMRYPFYSVDSSSWMQFGKYGLLIVPKKKGGKFVYDESPHIVVVSQRKKARKDADHFNNLPKIDQAHIREYVKMKGYKFGKSDLELVPHDKTKCEIPISDTEVSANEIIIEKGVTNYGPWRDELNMMFYLDLAERLPKWPWAWKPKDKFSSFILE